MDIKELHESVEWKARGDDNIVVRHEHPDIGEFELCVIDRIDKKGFDVEFRLGHNARLVDHNTRYPDAKEAVIAVYNMVLTYLENRARRNEVIGADAMLEAVRDLEFS